MQKKAAEITLEKVRKSKKISKGQILMEAGYTKNVSEQPQKVFDTEGFKEELENFGLTEELIKTSLVDDIKGKPRRRERELRLAAELNGLLTEKPQGNKTLIINITGENADRFSLLPKNEINKSTGADSTRSA